ncbi:MAG: hypothetical protein OWQ48_05960 [Desulfurococcus sp.]|nr:hypothetical protein [Desulfurococcus sp.]
MSVERRHKCSVCGRVFPEGQGIVLRKGSVVLEFHSSRCASKFFKTLLERMPASELEPYLKKLVEEYSELNEQKAKAKAKKI